GRTVLTWLEWRATGCRRSRGSFLAPPAARAPPEDRCSAPVASRLCSGDTREQTSRLWCCDGAVYVSISGVGLEALHRADGTVAWRYQTSARESLAAIANGNLNRVSAFQTTGAGWSRALVALSANNGTCFSALPSGRVRMSRS